MKLLHHGVLGLNARSLLYIRPFNPKKATAVADDKLKTKMFLSARGIPVAKLFGRIENRDQLRSFDFSVLPDEFVLKPNYGFGGEGIMVIKGKKKGRFLKNGKTPITEMEIRENVEDILDGKFSLGGRLDTAFFEQVLSPHDCFARFRPVGLPDLRIIVFNLVPVMAMLRIPTAESDGKANLHLGGIGIGIDMASGKTTHAAQGHRMIDRLPHGEDPIGIQIPYWEEILLHCSKIQQLTNIGYLAADITIDQQMGPALLEVNARAGLNVQVANLAPLRARLERVKGLKVTTPEKGVSIGMDLFGRKSKGASSSVTSEKPILGTHEMITITGDGTSIDVPCLIAPDRERTVITPGLYKELQEQKAVTEVVDEETVKIKFTLSGQKIQTRAEIGAVPNPDRAIIGKRDLGGFLIDPSREKPAERTRAAAKADLRAVDNLYAQLDRELLLLKAIKPVNLDEERLRLIADDSYSPLFVYQDLGEMLDEAEKKLERPVSDDSPLGALLEKKRSELCSRIQLFRSLGDAAAFTQASIAHFGAPDASLITDAQQILDERPACELPLPDSMLLTSSQAAERFEEVLKGYSLHDWEVSVRSRLVADCTVGGNHVYLREGAKFSEMHLSSLVAHEIETHVLTAENGDHQPYQILRRGTAGYIRTQEGLAVVNQNRVLTPYHEKRYGPARSVLAVAYGLEHTFVETRRYLEEELGYTKEKALTKALDVKRGLRDPSEHGGMTKGIVYLQGQQMVEEYLGNGGDLKKLYLGKISIEDLDLIDALPDLRPPLLLPEWVREAGNDA